MSFKRPQVTMGEYIREVEISALPRILVEGKRDKLVAERLLLRLQQRTLVDRIGGRVKSDDGIARPVRDVVRQLCLALSGSKVIGLVDREFDGFTVEGEKLLDREPMPNIPNCMMTRGHSIENYVFRAHFFWEGVMGTAVETNDYDKTRVEPLLRGWLPQLAALSLTGRECGVLGPLEAALGQAGSRAFGKDGNLDIDHIISYVVKGDAKAAKRLTDAYIQSWEMVSNCSVEAHQWLVAGHLGLRTLVLALEKFFGSRGHNEDDFFMCCMQAWVHESSPERDSILQFFDKVCSA